MSLTASVYPPILAGIIGRPLIYENLFDYHTDSYSHTSNVTVGYDSMDITIVAHEAEMRDWIADGIGRHIEVYSSAGKTWEGFVNQISIRSGAFDIRVGPAMDIANRIKVVYTTKRYDTNPPVGGDAAETAFADNLESQREWGIFEEIISGGEGDDTVMENMRAMALNELAFPKMSQGISPGSHSSMSISISCLGYYHLLSRYLFDDNVGDTGEVDISQKIADVLDADPNGLFSSSNAILETNTFQVGSYDDGTRTASAVIEELLGFGFSSGRRAYFKVKNDRYIEYGPLELDKEPKYVYSTYDQYPSLSYLDGTIVAPWSIEPGEWVEFESITSTPIDRDVPMDSDPKFMFIESVTFNSPNDVSIQGGRGATLSEKIGQLGLTTRYGSLGGGGKR